MMGPTSRLPVLKLLRSFSLLRRPAARPPHLVSANGQNNVPSVRFVRPVFTRKRLQMLTLTIAGVTILGNLLLEFVDEEEEEKQGVRTKADKTPSQLVKSAGHNSQSLVTAPGPFGNRDRLKNGAASSSGEDIDNGEVEDEDEDDDEIPDTIPEDAIFIPLGLIHQCPPTFYRGSDPEWQSFLEFSKDVERSINIRHELVGLIGRHLAGLRVFQKSLGTPIKPRKFWLDIDFPDGPPPEYVRSGVEITDDYIAWTTRSLSPAQYFRLKSILQPIPMLSALWASYRVMWSLQVNKVRALFNSDTKREQSSKETSTSPFNVGRFGMAKQRSDRQPTVEGKQPSKAESNTNSGAHVTEDDMVEEASDVSAQSKPSGVAMELPVLGQDMKIAMKTFERTLAKNWKQSALVLEKGTFMVSGLVEMEGSKANCVLDVRAAYHPAESRWVNVGIGVRRMQSRSQAPRGGY